MQTSELRALIRTELPPEAFRPQPHRGLLFIPLVGLIILGTWVVVTMSLPWYVSIIVSALLAQCYVSLWWLGHETIHGSTFRTRWLQNVVGYFAFAIFCYTPCLWRVWHNIAHHGNANQRGADPDSLIISDFDERPGLRRFRWFLPISRLGSVLFMLYGFTASPQFMLWVQSRYLSSFATLNRPRAIAESIVLMLFWIMLGVHVGLSGALYVIVLPMIFTNILLIAYGSTNHGLRPLVTANDPVEYGMSVTTYRWIDVIHLRFSHHVEHHLFPNMNWRFYPLVRQSLLKHVGDRYLAPPHGKALLHVLKTPHIYADPNTLTDYSRKHAYRISELESELRA